MPETPDHHLDQPIQTPEQQRGEKLDKAALNPDNQPELANRQESVGRRLDAAADKSLSLKSAPDAAKSREAATEQVDVKKMSTEQLIARMDELSPLASEYSTNQLRDQPPTKQQIQANAEYNRLQTEYLNRPIDAISLKAESKQMKETIDDQISKNGRLTSEDKNLLRGPVLADALNEMKALQGTGKNEALGKILVKYGSLAHRVEMIRFYERMPEFSARKLAEMKAGREAFMQQYPALHNQAKVEVPQTIEQLHNIFTPSFCRECAFQAWI